MYVYIINMHLSEPNNPGPLTVKTRSSTSLVLTSDAATGINSSWDIRVSPGLDEKSLSMFRENSHYILTLEDLTPGTRYTVDIWVISGSEKSDEVSLISYTSKFITCF